MVLFFWATHFLLEVILVLGSAIAILIFFVVEKMAFLIERIFEVLPHRKQGGGTSDDSRINPPAPAGRSLAVNLALLEANARLAAEIAVELAVSGPGNRDPGPAAA